LAISPSLQPPEEKKIRKTQAFIFSQSNRTPILSPAIFFLEPANQTQSAAFTRFPSLYQLFFHSPSQQKAAATLETKESRSPSSLLAKPKLAAPYLCKRKREAAAPPFSLTKQNPRLFSLCRQN
jgi:hypothetical protein